MKNTRKLIPAIALLLVSALLLSTASYAWFSMNTQVTATDMQVTVKSNNTFLLINTGDDDTAGEIQTAKLTTVALTVADADSDVYPAKPVLTSDEANQIDTNNGAGDAPALVTTKDTAEVVGNWFTATSSAPDSSTATPASLTQLTTFTDFVIKKTVYLTLAAGSNNANNLNVTSTIAMKDDSNDTTTDITAVKVLVATSDGGFAILDSTTTSADIMGSNTSLSDSTVLTVDIYIYYDGSDDSVYTNNIATLSAATIGLTFNVSVAPTTP